MVVIVLDEAVERAELRQVGAEHARVVHPPERGRHAPPPAQDREEQALELGRRPPNLVAEARRGVLELPLEVDVEVAAELLSVPKNPEDASGVRLKGTGLHQV